MAWTRRRRVGRSSSRSRNTARSWRRSRRWRASNPPRAGRRAGTRSWAWLGGSGWRRGDAGGGCRPRGNETGRPVPERPVRCVVRRSGVGGDRRAPSHHGPAVALAQEAQLRELRLVQLGVPVGQIQHRVVEPFLLMVGGRFQDATAEDVGEQLVSGLLKRGGGRQLAGFRTLFGHAGAVLSRAESRGGGSTAQQCNRRVGGGPRP